MRQHRKPELILFYDDHCPICTASAEHMRRADRRDRVAIVPASDADALDRHGIDAEQALTRLQGVLTHSGKRLDGIHALYEAAKRLPRWWVAVPLLWLSARLGFGQRLYDAIAVRRLGISRLVCGGACPVPHEGDR